MDWASSLSGMQQHHTLATGLQYLSTISPAQWCQIFYLLAAGCVLIVASAPAEARTLLINYGARKASSTASPQIGAPPQQQQSQQSQPPGPGEQNHGHQKGKKLLTSTGHQQQERNKTETAAGKEQIPRTNIFVSLIALVTSYGQVPHSWFAGFYVVSVGCSLFWASQYFLLLLYSSNDGDGKVGGGATWLIRGIASKQVSSSATSSSGLITHVQLLVAWSMMLLQGTRRVYEHLVVMRPSSKSTMWFVHWVLGLGFYVFTNVAVWVEGAETILTPTIQPQTSIPALLLTGILTSLSSVFPKLAIGIATFLYAYTRQYRTHKHLASLKKYSLPSSDPRASGTRLFECLVCPHYTCECLLYLAIAITASPRGQLVNRTLLCGLVFVVVNLGVTARGTRAWYVDKFGADAVKGKWNMIPFVF